MYNTLLLIQYISIILIIGAIFYVMRQKPSVVQKDLLLLEMALLVMMMSYTLEMQATDMGAAVVATKMSYVGRSIAMFAMVFLVIDISALPIRNIFRTITAAIHVVFILLIFTYERHGLFYKSVRFVNEGLFPHLVKDRGPLYYCYTGFLLINAIGMIVVCLYKAKNIKNDQDKNILALFGLMLAASFLGYFMYYGGYTDGYNLSILGNAFGTFIFIYIFIKYDMFDSLNVAWEKMFERIGAGIIVYDHFGKLIYQNEIAKEIGIRGEVEKLSKTGGFYFYYDKVYSVEKIPITGDGVNYSMAYFINNETDTYDYRARLEEEISRANENSQANTLFIKNIREDICAIVKEMLLHVESAKAEIDGNDRIKAVESLNKISMSGNELVELMEEALIVDEIETGHLDSIECDFNISTVLGDVINACQNMGEEKEYTVSDETEPIEHPWVRGDKDSIHRIISNVIKDSVEKIDNGGIVTVKMSEVTSTEVSSTYKIIVRDNSNGMSEDELNKLFDYDVNTKGEKACDFGSITEGLPATKQLVELIGGKISARSTLGVGTTFEIIIPIKLSAMRDTKSE